VRQPRDDGVDDDGDGDGREQDVDSQHDEVGPPDWPLDEDGLLEAAADFEEVHDEEEKDECERSEHRGAVFPDLVPTDVADAGEDGDQRRGVDDRDSVAQDDHRLVESSGNGKIRANVPTTST